MKAILYVIHILNIVLFYAVLGALRFAALFLHWGLVRCLGLVAILAFVRINVADMLAR